MIRHLWHPTRPLCLGLALVALAIWALFAALAPTADALPLDVPPVPHTFEGRQQCLLCHSAGSTQAMPADHQGRPEATCQACHTSAAGPAQANPQSPAAPAAPAAAAPAKPAATGDAACLACHSAPVTAKLASGESVGGAVDGAAFASSAHGGKIGCIACHADKSSGYPHPKPTATDRRSYAVVTAQQCVACHSTAAEPYERSVHGEAVFSGKLNAATCVDCHGAHSVADADRLSRKPQLCAACHTSVTDTYQKSVHGQLLAQGRADAASCLSCHTKDNSGHSLLAVDDPEGPTAEKNVPASCGACHNQALKTYETTFHGRATRLGTSGQAPTCVDCHGAYGVQRVHSAERPVSDTDFAAVCAKCHTDATESFASGWMGHEEASPGWFPVVFFTERFLFFLTSSVVAFGIVHVELDLLRHIVRRRKDQGKKEK